MTIFERERERERERDLVVGDDHLFPLVLLFALLLEPLLHVLELRLGDLIEVLPRPHTSLASARAPSHASHTLPLCATMRTCR